MIALVCFVLAVLTSPFKSKSRLEAENAALRHQLAILRRKLKGRARLTNSDRWFFVQLYRSGSHRSFRFSQSFVPRRWYVGIGPAFAAIGVGSHGDGADGRQLMQSCVG